MQAGLNTADQKPAANKPCRACGGTGKVKTPTGKRMTCFTCRGTGKSKHGYATK